MRIYSMTATFGKLEHETLKLEPGLNVIEAPNEWGKSTWCAFLIAMLYGLDTRERSKKGTIADKERFAPWSGSPMSGRIDLRWQGRDITIERRAKGPIPMGELIAYETATGVPVPELTAATCGQVLLGVERSVFTRSAFIRSSDMPVTEDEGLRSRLNALVTTGDDGCAAEELGRKLRDLKNKIRYNRSGLLPEAEAERGALKSKLEELDGLTAQVLQLRRQQAALDSRIKELEEHEMALAHAAAMDDQRKVEAAVEAEAQAALRLAEAEAGCKGLPDRAAAVSALERERQRQQRWEQIRAMERDLPPIPEMPEVPDAFRDMDPADALWQAQRDETIYYELRRPVRSPWLIFLLLGIAAMGVGAVLAVLALLIPGSCLAVLGAALAVCGILFACKAGKEKRGRLSKKMALERRYGSDDPDQWIAMAYGYRDSWENYRVEDRQAREAREALTQARDGLELETEEGVDHEAVIAAWDLRAVRLQEWERSRDHLQVLRSMARPIPEVPVKDTMTETAQQTKLLLAEATQKAHTLQLRLGQCLGRMDLLGDRETLRRSLEASQRRIRELEKTFKALSYGLEALEASRLELQRRFAPRITRQAQNLFARLTGGRYDRLTMAQDLSIHAGAVGEDTLRGHLWRSEGTIDQLYLAVRLAVARELTPDAPLILDDALIRFDAQRMATAMKILAEEAATKQVVVFSCRG